MAPRESRAAVGSDPVVLVTGAGGQVGRSLRQELPAARFLTRQDLDVTDGAAVRSLLKGTDVVVHLAAMTNVDRCEAEPDAAERVNGWGTGVVVDAAAASGARVVYLSTDYVFDGRKRGEYIEDDAPAPVNVYGRSKLAGEERVRAREENLIVRTSWVFGDGRNFVRTIVDAARAGRPFRRLCRRARQRHARRRRRWQCAGRRLRQFDRAAAAERAGPGWRQHCCRIGKPGTPAGTLTLLPRHCLRQTRSVCARERSGRSNPGFA